MKKFTSGFFAGTATTVIAAMGLVKLIKKQVIEPMEQKEAIIDENRKKAHRKSHAR